jgi:hypothetical protein
MKNLIYILLFILITTPVFKANSQTSILNPVIQNQQNVTHVKEIDSKYFNSKVYLHFTVNGNTETKTVAVERSLDATNYEVIGYVTIIGNNVTVDLAYYFTDELPVLANLYYRLSEYSQNNEANYSETTSVIPIEKTKAATDMVLVIPVCNEDITVGVSN